MGPSAKRRRLDNSKVEEIVFDNAARHDYLTGFHKRKVQRTKLAQEAAAKKARQERIEDRKRLREERKAEIENHVQEINRWLRPDGGLELAQEEGDASTETWDGLADPPTESIDHETDYVDEEKYTTVTVEAVDITREGLFKSETDARGDSRDEGKEDDDGVRTSGRQVEKRKPNTMKKARDSNDKPKKRRKDFRYESRGDRKMNRLKERAKNSRQAKARRNG